MAKFKAGYMRTFYLGRYETMKPWIEREFDDDDTSHMEALRILQAVIETFGEESKPPSSVFHGDRKVKKG